MLDSQWKTVVHDDVFSVVLCPLRRWNCEYITAVTFGAELKLLKIPFRRTWIHLSFLVGFVLF